MLNLIASGIIALIEKELINHTPEMEALVIKQLQALVEKLVEFIAHKTGNGSGIRIEVPHG